ncbi:hypothetical protein, partial [Pseudomonas sp. MWU12-2323]|uniref:hypothetical protein n=1 Tax=Pseudomonas sp. MWU12-2323 TaxID=2651296 RepID=UPI0015B78B12
LGLYRQDNDYTLEQGDPNDFGGGIRFRDVGVQTRLVVDQFDNPRWPRSGDYFSGQLGAGLPSMGSEVNQKFYDLTGELAHTYGDFTARLTAKAKGNVDVRSEASVPQQLGGFLNLTGYQNGELLADRIGLARLMVYWRAASLPPV